MPAKKVTAKSKANGVADRRGPLVKTSRDKEIFASGIARGLQEAKNTPDPFTFTDKKTAAFSAPKIEFAGNSINSFLITDVGGMQEVTIAGRKYVPVDQAGINGLLAERGKAYGDFSFGSILEQGLKDELRAHIGWHNLSADKKAALDMIMHKASRILNGDPNYKDSWVDIQGYAKLAEDRCSPCNVPLNKGLLS